MIVLTWNGKALTMDCLKSLMAMAYPNTDVIVVDNHSTDGTADAVRAAWGGRVTLIENPKNLGFAKGNNVGIQHALERGAEWILLLNNDTVVDHGLVDHLVAAADRWPDAGIFGPKIYYAAPPDQIWFAGGEVFLGRGTARHIGIRERDMGQYDTPHEVDYISGCALMARREVFEKIGGLDPAYEAYFEDTDFCMRARRNGFGVRFVPEGRVWHRISASTGGQLGLKKIRRKLVSTVRFFSRYASPHHWLTIPLFFTLDVFRIILLVSAGRIRNTPGPGGPPSHNGSTT